MYLDSIPGARPGVRISPRRRRSLSETGSPVSTATSTPTRGSRTEGQHLGRSRSDGHDGRSRLPWRSFRSRSVLCTPRGSTRTPRSVVRPDERAGYGSSLRVVTRSVRCWEGPRRSDSPPEVAREVTFRYVTFCYNQLYSQPIRLGALGDDERASKRESERVSSEVGQPVTSAATFASVSSVFVFSAAPVSGSNR